MEEKRYLGLSLSFCVKDILEYRIDINNIAAIVTSTAFLEMEDALRYYGIYWRALGSPEVIRKVLAKIWPLVFQPRLANEHHPGHSIVHGHWVDLSTGETTFKVSR